MNMFESVCNACSPRPAVFYVFEKGELRNVNARFVDEFDAEIARAVYDHFDRPGNGEAKGKKTADNRR